jgi:MFS family permease
MPLLPSLLLNIAHALDHLFLLIFATAVGAIAVDFGIARWEDLMPYTAGAFLMFGLCSIPAGRLGDLRGRRWMMLLFFHGMGLSAIAVALTQNAWQIGRSRCWEPSRPSTTRWASPCCCRAPPGRAAPSASTACRAIWASPWPPCPRAFW